MYIYRVIFACTHTFAYQPKAILRRLHLLFYGVESFWVPKYYGHNRLMVHEFDSRYPEDQLLERRNAGGFFVCFVEGVDIIRDFPHTHTHTHTQTNAYTYIYIHTNTCIYIYIYTRNILHMYIFIYTLLLPTRRPIATTPECWNNWVDACACVCATLWETCYSIIPVHVCVCEEIIIDANGVISSE